MGGSAEDRLAALEQTVARLGAFDQVATVALRQTTDQLKALAGSVAALDREMAARRAVELLARASRFYPKERRVVFVGRSYFGDNIKYAYLAFQDYAHIHGIACHYLTDDERQIAMLKETGLPYMSATPAEWTADDARALLATAVMVLGDNFHMYSFQNPRAFGMLQGAKTAQLWHGIPIKQIGLGYVMRGDGVMMEELLASSGPFDVLAAPGAAMESDWRRHFAFRDFAPIGYPRTDVFFREPSPYDLLNVDLQVCELLRAARGEGKTTILYAPTYRDDAGHDWFAETGVPALAAYCAAQGYVFAINLHPYEAGRIADLRARHPDILFAEPGTDVYPVVKQADILLTDYSSLMFDFLLLDRPVVFYRAGDCIAARRGLVEGRTAMAPGAVAATMEDVQKALDESASYARDPARDPFRAARQKLCAELYDRHDGDAGQRLCAAIDALLVADRGCGSAAPLP
ncbi:MAG TPA: CDP-glycerol glycerophosphotransferase family protein [Alphaproteobacteria bacterium]|nr:CDP-glycerol glycerophosphotransferase family protein [Alphaproteobacteria bacterium]